jgi:hypothetical protein
MWEDDPRTNQRRISADPRADFRELHGGQSLVRRARIRQEASMLIELSRGATRQTNLSGDFDPHRYKFLGRGWMNADGFVELSLGSAAIERDG